MAKQRYEKFGSRNFNATGGASAGDGEGDIIWYGSTDVYADRLYYLTEVEGTTTWASADASAESTSSTMLAIALGNGAANEVGMLIRGMVHMSVGVDGTDGQPIFVSTTAAQVTSSKPTGTGDIVRIVGNQMADNKLWFNPDNTYIKLS